MSTYPHSSHPNFVLIVADDWGYYDSHCYGHPVIRTPNIDHLASQGMRLDTAFTCTAMCAPSRSSLYTGLYTHRHGCHMNHGQVKPGTKSLAHYLTELGYRVGLAGKTHIGPEECFPFQYLPQNMEVIGKFMAEAGPFCLVIASSRPHLPHEATATYEPREVIVPPKWIDTPETRRQLTGYYTDITRYDDEVGQILGVISQLKLEERTLVACTSDHGNQFFAKWTCYDDGLRVPLVVRWPEHVRPGSFSRAWVGHIDMVPTLVQAAGGEAPPDLDGESFLSVLTGLQDAHHDVLFGAQTNQGVIAGKPYPIRSVRTDRYKYIRNLMPDATYQNVNTHRDMSTERTSGVWASWLAAAKSDPRAAHWVQWHRHRPAEELYDLENDFRELSNLADEASLANMKTQLSARLDAWMKQQGDTGIAAEMAVEPHTRTSEEDLRRGSL